MAVGIGMEDWMVGLVLDWNVVGICEGEKCVLWFFPALLRVPMTRQSCENA